DEEASPWRPLADHYTVKDVQALDRVLDCTICFTHVNVAQLPEEKRRIVNDLHQSDQVLSGRRVLIVDDDMRNIFALSTVLEDHGMRIVSADSGREAVRILQRRSDIDIVLMDIMMPEMDGMETMREIRRFAHLRDLP